MGKVATGTEPQELIPARIYYFVCSGMYDIGTQNGQFGLQTQLIATFEIQTRKGPLRNKKGEVVELSAFLNFYLGKPDKPQLLAKLAQAIEKRTFSAADYKAGWDVEKAVGGIGKAQVVQKLDSSSVMKNRIEGFASIDEDDEFEITPSLDQHYFEITPAVIASREIPEFVPKWIHAYIKKSVEFTKGSGQGEKAMAGAGVGGGDDEDIPF